MERVQVKREEIFSYVTLFHSLPMADSKSGTRKHHEHGINIPESREHYKAASPESGASLKRLAQPEGYNLIIKKKLKLL